MALVLAQRTRRGTITTDVACAADQNMVELFATFGVVDPGVGFEFKLEQFEGRVWSLLGGGNVPELGRTLLLPEKDGSVRTGLRWRFYEQLVEDAKDWTVSRDYQVAGRRMRQLAVCPQLRLTTESYTIDGQGQRQAADLAYSFDVTTDNRLLPLNFVPLAPGG